MMGWILHRRYLFCSVLGAYVRFVFHAKGIPKLGSAIGVPEHPLSGFWCRLRGQRKTLWGHDCDGANLYLRSSSAQGRSGAGRVQRCLSAHHRLLRLVLDGPPGQEVPGWILGGRAPFHRVTSLLGDLSSIWCLSNNIWLWC